MKYSGADWLIKSYPDIKVSDLGKKVADILGMVWYGLYHIAPQSIKKVNWDDTYCISIALQCSLSTFDYNELTELVILCHDQTIRLNISPNMRYLRLFFHQRQRDGIFTVRHPTIEEAIQTCRTKWNEIDPRAKE